jgi:superfamily I DNA/RNA helicase
MKTTTLAPTSEQQDIIDTVGIGGNLVIQAGAGTGKTSTLQLVAHQLPATDKVLYVAYNKAIATEAATKFPNHVTCRTSHSLAFGAVGRNFSHRLNSGRTTSFEVAKKMGLGWLNLSRDIAINPSRLATISADTVRRFCYSADTEITASHVPFQNGVTGSRHNHLAATVLPIAQRWWTDVNDAKGSLPFEHDHYLKMWALTNPELPYDVIFLDEAQDSNPVLADLILRQTHAQQVVVGDGCQQMYAWRGAVDAMKDWPNATQLYLTQSWRFGQEIADEANKWLSLLPTPLRLSGNPAIKSRLEDVSEPRAVLCRTNAGAMAVVLEALDNERKVAMVGGGQQLARLAQAATDLLNGKRTSHPELYAFPNWAAVCKYAQEETTGRDLLPLVNLIDTHGPERIIAATQAMVNEDQADIVASTTHKAKGREWDSVRAANDFFVPYPNDDGEVSVSDGEAMIGYVAITRAREVLDRGGLAWIDDFVSLINEE